MKHEIERWTRQPWLPDAFALAFLLAATLYLFKDTIWRGLHYFEADTLNFYYPIFATAQGYLRQGIYPLIWTPDILAGFPLFADGEVGMLYPLNLAAMFLLPAAQAFALLTVVRFFLAAAFMYAFARVLDTGRLGALVAAMVFAFGSFLIAQMHHANLTSGAIWLPVILLCIEKAVRSSGVRRDAYLAGAGVVLAVQLLAVHVQPVIMTLLALSIYACLRIFAWPLAPGVGDPAASRLGSFARRSLLLARVLIVIPVVGVSLAAVQLVPLYELSAFSFRSVSADYRFASTYSSTVFDLISLIFPYFFRSADGSSWSIWGAWEPTIYIGIAPLILAGVGALFVRNRYVLVFAVIAVTGLAYSLGPYSPLPLHWLLWHLPGFSTIRAPGRFTFLFLFGAAMLAAFGARWVMAQVDQRTGSSRDRWPYYGYLAAWGAFALWLLFTMRVDAEWLAGNKSDALRFISWSYLKLFDNPLRVTAEQVYDGLLYSADLGNTRTLAAFALLAGALLLLWLGFKRSPRLGAGLLLAIIAVDLLPYGQAFHPSTTLESPDVSGAVSFPSILSGEGSGRVYNMPGLSSLEPNRLLPRGVPVFSGYSSLEPDRHREYEWWLAQGNKALLDLAGIRYVIEPKKSDPRRPPRPSGHQIDGVRVDPERTLASGSSLNPNSRASFMIQPTRATSLRVVATLGRALDIQQGEEVAEIVVRGEGGESQIVKMRAGQHLSELAYDRDDVRPKVRHRKAPVALTLPGADHLNRPQDVNLYFAELSLSAPVKVTRLDFRYVHAKGRIQLYGVSLFDGKTVTQVPASAKYVKVYEDEETVIYENPTPLPRAFIVNSVKVVPSDPRTLGEMAQGDIDVTRTAVVEEEIPELRGAAIGPGEPGTPAKITFYSPTRATVEAEPASEGLLVLSDSYYPGWTVLVDGEPRKVYRADYLFRGVPLSAGRHRVEFIYDPPSLKLGAAVSLGAALVLLVAAACGLRRRGDER
ncbi:MAG: YfhO family protein [Chloroflexi bacterium]|nr:YfhO family protein [Chloroflexota bacterium]